MEKWTPKESSSISVFDWQTDPHAYVFGPFMLMHSTFLGKSVVNCKTKDPVFVKK